MPSVYAKPQESGAVRRMDPKRMSGTMTHERTPPKVRIPFQHLRKGRLYKIRMPSVNAQSNLVRGESVWLESETQRIVDVRRQPAVAKSSPTKKFHRDTTKPKKTRVRRFLLIIHGLSYHFLQSSFAFIHFHFFIVSFILDHRGVPSQFFYACTIIFVFIIIH